MQNSQISKPKRNSSIELLRIIAMIMIIFHHYAIHGGFTFDTSIITIPYLWYKLIIMGGKIGVNIFIFISGYYLIMDNSNSLNFRKISKLWGQLLFYSVSITTAIFLIGKGELGGSSIFSSFFPISNEFWGFASRYFILYLFHPYLNILLTNLNKKTYQKLIIIICVLWYIIPTFFGLLMQSNSLIMYICLYIFAAYIRLHGLNNKLTAFNYLLATIAMTLFTYILSISWNLIATKYGCIPFKVNAFYEESSIFMLLISISLFMMFIKINLPYNKIINITASCTFGIFLLHDYAFIRNFLWTNLFKSNLYQWSLKIIPYSIIAVCIVFITGVIIDLIRQKYFQPIFMIIITKYGNKIKNISKLCVNKLSRLISDTI